MREERFVMLRPVKVIMVALRQTYASAVKLSALGPMGYRVLAGETIHRRFPQPKQ